MDIKRWPTFLALVFTLSFRAFALAQGANGNLEPIDKFEHDVPRVKPQRVSDALVVEEVQDADKQPTHGKQPAPVTLPPGVILLDSGTGEWVRMPAVRGQGGIQVQSTVPKMLIGVSMAEVPDSLRAHLTLAEGAGILVGAVVPDGPADKAGLQRYDILLKAGDKDLKHPQDLQALVDLPEAKPISIQFQRRGEVKTAEVTPIKREEMVFTDSKLKFSGNALMHVNPQVRFSLPDGRPLTPTELKSYLTPSPVLPPSVPVDALTSSIQALTEQVERLQKSIDKLEKKAEAQEAQPAVPQTGTNEQ